MVEHELKTWPTYFQAIWDNKKHFEVRLNDRGFQVGDHLILQEYSPDSLIFLGRIILAEVLYIYAGPEIKKGYVVMSIQCLRFEPVSEHVQV